MILTNSPLSHIFTRRQRIELLLLDEPFHHIVHRPESHQSILHAVLTSYLASHSASKRSSHALGVISSRRLEKNGCCGASCISSSSFLPYRCADSLRRIKRQHFKHQIGRIFRHRSRDGLQKGSRLHAFSPYELANLRFFDHFQILFRESTSTPHFATRHAEEANDQVHQLVRIGRLQLISALHCDLEKRGSVEHLGQHNAAGPNIDFVRVGLIKTRSQTATSFSTRSSGGL